MTPAALEATRVATLREFAILDTPSEADFDDLTELARALFGVPVALVSLVDGDRQWFKSHPGLDMGWTARSVSFCSHALESRDVLVVPDAFADPRFAANPLVTGEPKIRFYAGAPLIADGGAVLGTLCVIDNVPRDFGEAECRQLAGLARQVMAQLTLRRQAHLLAREVTAHETARAELENNRTLLTAILAATDSMVYAKDLEGRFVLVNPALATMLGRSEQQILGLDNHDLFPAPAADTFHRHDREVITSSTAHTYDEALPHPDGSIHHFISAKFPLRDSDGAVFGVGGVSTDVTTLVEQHAALDASRQRWHALFTGSPVGIILIDHHDVIIEVNDEFSALVGRDKSEIVGQVGQRFGQLLGLSQQQDPAVLIDSSPDGIVRSEVSFLDITGAERWGLLSITHVAGRGQEPWTLGLLQDITDRRRGEMAAAESAANLQAVARVVREIQNGADARQTIVDAGCELAGAAFVSLLEPDDSGAALRVSASTDERLIGSEVALASESVTVQVYRSGQAQFVADPESHPRISPALLALTGSKSIYAVPVQSSHTSSGVLLVAWSQRLSGLDDQRAAGVTLLADQAGVALRQVALLAELDSLAHTDALTSLPNRRNWDAQLALRLESARRTGRPLTIALADLDHFKRYNDTFGHPEGDTLLKRFGERAAASLRINDLLARWGGEEFAIALTECAADDAPALLDRIRAAVPSGQTCSIGHATWDGLESAEQLTRRADQALYRAKSAGRNRIVPSS